MPNVTQYFFDTRLSLLSYIRQLFELRGLVRSKQINVIHAQYGTITGFVCLLSRQNAKLVTTFRGSDLGWSPSVGFARNLISKMLSYIVLIFCDYAILVSRSLCPNHRLFNARSMVLPTGVNCDVFFPTNREEAQKHLGWNPNSFHLLFNSGMNSLVKRLDLAIAAFSIVRERNPDVELHVMRGDVPASQVPIWMNGANLLLMLSDREGSPTVVQEALACGTSVLAVPVGDTVDHLLDREDCIIVQKNVDSIVAGIDEMIMRSKIKEFHKKENFVFDYKNTCQIIIKVYKALYADADYLLDDLKIE